MEQRGTIEIETQHDPSQQPRSIIVADDGPGIPVSERDKLFLPYYSTKRRGSGLVSRSCGGSSPSMAAAST